MVSALHVHILKEYMPYRAFYTIARSLTKGFLSNGFRAESYFGHDLDSPARQLYTICYDCRVTDTDFWKGEIVSIGMIINLMRTGIFQVFILAAPILLAALVVGLIVAIFQATTSIQEQTLTFVPKILTILGMLALLGGWMSGVLRDYTIRLFEIIPQLVQG